MAIDDRFAIERDVMRMIEFRDSMPIFIERDLAPTYQDVDVLIPIYRERDVLPTFTIVDEKD